MQEEEPFSTRDSALDLLELERKDVRRPMNAFLIFCKRHRSIVRQKNPDLDNRSVTRILGGLWANLKDDEKCIYTNLAKQYKDAFMKANPDYKWHNPEKVQHPLNKPVVRPTNMRIVCNEIEFQTDGGITPGKLADPSNMGGLSLLLMAGQQTQVSTNIGNKQEHSYVQQHPPVIVKQKLVSPSLPQSQKNAAPVLPQSQRNSALLQLAEMCSNELHCQSGGQKARIPNEKIGGWSHDTNLANVYRATSGSQNLCPPLSVLPNSHPSQVGLLEHNLSLSASANQHLSRSKLANQHPYQSRPASQHQSQSEPSYNHQSHSEPSNQQQSHSEPSNQSRSEPSNQHQTRSEPSNQLLSQSGAPGQHPFLPSKSNQDPLYPIKVDQYSTTTKTQDGKQSGDHKISFQQHGSLLEEALKDDPITRTELKKAQMPNFSQADTDGSINTQSHKPLVGNNKNMVDCIIDKFFISSGQPQVYIDPNIPEQQVPLNLVKKEAKCVEHESSEHKLEAKHIGKDVKFIEIKETDSDQLVDTTNTDLETVDTKSNVREIIPDSNEIKPVLKIVQKCCEELQVSGEKSVKEEPILEIDHMEIPFQKIKTEISSNPDNNTEKSVVAAETVVCIGQSPDQEGDYEIDYEEEQSDDYQPVRKSKRRNRGQRYKELINEGIIQPSKERLAAMRSEQTGTCEESVSDEDDCKGLENVIDQYPPVIRRARKRTVSESERAKLQPHGDDGKRYKTGDFDLEAHIATLPACSLENVSRNGRRAHAAKARHNSDSCNKKLLLGDGEITVESSFCLPPHVKLKKNESVSQNLVGSKKRKARKYSINRMLPMPEETKQVMMTVGSVSAPSDIVIDQQVENDGTEKQLNANKVMVGDDSVLQKDKISRISDGYGTPSVLYACGEGEKKSRSLSRQSNGCITNCQEQLNGNNSRSTLSCTELGDQSSVVINESPSENFVKLCLLSQKDADSRLKTSLKTEARLEKLDAVVPLHSSNDRCDGNFAIEKPNDTIRVCENSISNAVRKCCDDIKNKTTSTAPWHPHNEFDVNSNNMVDINITGEKKQPVCGGIFVSSDEVYKNSDVQFVDHQTVSDDRENIIHRGNCRSESDANDISISSRPKPNQLLPGCADHCKLNVSCRKCVIKSAENIGAKMENGINFESSGSLKIEKSDGNEPDGILRQKCKKNVTQLLENNPELVLMETLRAPNGSKSGFDESTTK